MKIERNESDFSMEVVDSSYFFEGTEKLLEIWFASSGQGDKADLRLIHRSEWEQILKNVNCAILSTRNDSMTNSFLLSESSMFIAKNRLILKTCGKTTLLEAIQPLLDLVLNKCEFDIILDVFYSHKNYMRPDLQPSTYRHFDQEVATLDTFFKCGSAYVLGRVNKDCWYIYTMNNGGIDVPDQTLELMMMDVDKQVMSMFTQDSGMNAMQLTKQSGIAGIFADAVIDDWLFEPCGYSMNALLPNGGYFTIHITPEADFSYVSFETNAPRTSYNEIINYVLDLFKPHKFIVTLITNQSSTAADYQVQDGNFKSFDMKEHQMCKIKNYNMTYALYRRPRDSSLTVGK